MKSHALGLFILGALMASCAVLESLRVGATTGYVDAQDGHRDMHAVTGSVTPFAGLSRDEDCGALRDRLRLTTAQRDEYAGQLAVWEGHACEERMVLDGGETMTVSDYWHGQAEHWRDQWVEHECPTSDWWMDPEAVLYVLGGIIALLGGGEAVRRRQKRKREQQEPESRS